MMHSTHVVWAWLFAHNFKFLLVSWPEVVEFQNNWLEPMLQVRCRSTGLIPQKITWLIYLVETWYLKCTQGTTRNKVS
jgi:hypothetical protein